ncbi:MAG: hypothetical protein H0T84_03155 [Tatlockia sp.]|nr:hypothetical protein [Tatlockia sp.]
MPEILYDANRISVEELQFHSKLIYRLQSGELKFPNIKMLKEILYNGLPIYRAKINEKERLIYTYLTYSGVRTLCILAANDHNYQRLKRQLKSPNPSQIDLINLQDEELNLLKTNPEPIKFLPAVPHKNTMVAWDEQQHQCHIFKGAVIFLGPPGAGKTLVLYNNMLRNIYAQENMLKINGVKLSVLFISQSRRMVNTLTEDYKQLELNRPVEFVTWLDFIVSYYPGKKMVGEKDFKIWLTGMKWKDDPRELHYELSLIIALGEDKYLQLGNRQCHFAEDIQKKGKLIQLLKNWQMHLKKNESFDPMICQYSSEKGCFAEIYCDETQNLPPAALAFLIGIGNQYIASLDSEQCLLSSPYIHNCLKELLYTHYKKYAEIQLAKTWRCPPEIIAVGNHLMDSKYRIDGSGNRREYKEVESTLPKGSGLISWIDTQNLPKLKNLCLSAETVIIVEVITDKLRLEIQETLGTNNILTPKDAIGLEFDNVILWNPFSQRECFRELAQRIILPDSGLSLEQWNAINAIYVSITRGQKRVYLFDDLARKRLKTLPGSLLGVLLENQFDHSETIEESKIQWLALIKKYLNEGQIDNAVEIMRFHLAYSNSVIETIINNSLSQENKASNINTTNTTSTLLKAEVLTTATNSITKKIRPITTENRQVGSKPVIAVNTEQQRINTILSNFNQNTLKSLFKAKDGMRILFEIPTGVYYCLFSRCLADRTKFVTFKKFIKENGKIVAEKITPQRLIAAQLIYTTPERSGDQKEQNALITHLYSQNNESILHLLLEKYSAVQRVSFIGDSLIYSSSNNFLLEDKQIQTLLVFNDKTLFTNSRQLVDLLCQPTIFAPEASYLYSLSNSAFGISLIYRLINDQTLFRYICDNLYSVQLKYMGSIFHMFSFNEISIEILRYLYENEPRLKGLLSIEDLLGKKSTNSPPPFHTLCKSVNGGLTLLNKLITPELAAQLPHALPKLFNLFFLSCSQDGIEVIIRMMDAQADMVAKMTGELISKWPDSDRVSILALLSINKSGPIILNRLLDFHGKEFVGQLTDDALFYPPLEDDNRGAYEYLHDTEQGKIFLKQLRHYGWMLPYPQAQRFIAKQIPKVLPLSSQAAFFSTSKQFHEISKPFHAKPINILLWHLSKDNIEQVIKIISSKPYLLLQSGNFIDSLGNSYKNMSPIEYCNLEIKHQYLVEIMLNCLNANDENREIRESLLSQQATISSDFRMGL